jgi:hypothetical protein
LCHECIHVWSGILNFEYNFTNELPEVEIKALIFLFSILL